jgi:hypothetical protein
MVADYDSRIQRELGHETLGAWGTLGESTDEGSPLLVEPHMPHQPGNPLMIHLVTSAPEPSGHSSDAVKRPRRRLLIYQSHENLILTVVPPGPIIQA